MMEVYTSDSSDSDSRELRTLNYSRLELTPFALEATLLQQYPPITTPPPSQSPSPSSAVTTVQYLANGNSSSPPNNHHNAPAATITSSTDNRRYGDIETVLLAHNLLRTVPLSLARFANLHVLDISANGLTELPDFLAALPLTSLIAKNNALTDRSLPKTLLSRTGVLRELNLSGNQLTRFPDQILELRGLKYLYLGGNKIGAIPKDVWKVQSLQILSMGGNLLTDVPESVGNLSQLQGLILCDNLIENLPTSIARLKHLKSLLLHRNRLKHLPRDIISLRNLVELSLRDNPLVVRFVQDITLNPSSLLELAARTVRSHAIEYGPADIPRRLAEYLQTAHCCVNPKCSGVFFDNRIEHIKFVDFCGKYRVPLLQYLCSSKCIEPATKTPEPQAGASGFMMRKVLLG